MKAREADSLISRAIELHRGGRLEEAARCYRRAAKLCPRDALVHVRFGAALQSLGRADQALDAFAIAYLEAPDEYDSRLRLVEALAHTSELRVAARLRRALEALADDDAVRHQRLVPVLAGFLKRQPPVARALRRIQQGGSLAGRDLRADLYRSLSAPLVLRLLRDCVFSDEAIEALSAALRSAWLEALVEGSSVTWPAPELLEAMALQALTTEWIHPESAGDRARIARLETTLDEPAARIRGGAPTRALWVYSLYRPLDRFADDPALLDAAQGGDGPVPELLRRHLIEPARERSLGAALPRLTAVEDEASSRVRAQYEERPYPRWRTLQRRAARPLGEALAASLGDPELARTLSVPALRILVAGCGTGRHAIATATRFSGARVLAVDLSRTSLGFAARQAGDLGIDNIEFAQADLLGLSALPDRFDVVECSGVLHHLADPEAGWRVLRGLLAPGGLMRIGLYSERGRSFLEPIRALIAERGFEASPEGIRATRAAIRGLPDDAPARRVTTSPDFYALSGCRDLFFPAHEDRFDLPRVARALEQLELELLGFELPDPRVLGLYRQRFPDDPKARDLENWDRLEREIPTLFAAMYQFWCRARG